DLVGCLFKQASLAGACFTEAHLERADLSTAHLEGKNLESDDVARLHKWMPTWPVSLASADLRLAYLDSATRLRDTILGNAEFGYLALVSMITSICQMRDHSNLPPFQNYTVGGLGSVGRCSGR